MPARKMFPDSIMPLPTAPGPAPNGLIVNVADTQHRADEMHLHFALGVPAAARQELEDRVAKGEVVPLSEQASKYGADASAANALVAWLKKEGFKVSHVTPDSTSVYASAPASQVEASLGVHMVRVTRDGQSYTAASDVPSLPSEVAGEVTHIGGLQPFRRMHKHSRVSHLTPSDDAEAAAPKANKPPYLVAEILKAYDADGLNLTGNGQEIAILIDTVPLDSDMSAFWALNNVNTSHARITKINVTGGTLPPPEGEETLDTQWTSGIAQGADIRIYACGSLQFTNLNRALDMIIADAANRPAMRQVSISLGLGETFLHGPKGEVDTEHQKFLSLAAAGINVFVSTGDAGSNPDSSGIVRVVRCRRSTNRPIHASLPWAAHRCVSGRMARWRPRPAGPAAAAARACTSRALPGRKATAYRRDNSAWCPMSPRPRIRTRARCSF